MIPDAFAWLITRPVLMLSLSSAFAVVVAIYCLDFPDEDSRKRVILACVIFFSFFILAAGFSTV